MRESMPALSLPPKEQPSKKWRNKANATPESPLTPTTEYLRKKALDDMDMSSLDKTLEKMPKKSVADTTMDVRDDEILSEWGTGLAKKIDTVKESPKARKAVPFSGLTNIRETERKQAEERESRTFNVPETKKPEAPQEKVVIDQDRLATLRKHIEKPEDSVQIAKEKLQQRLQGLSAEEGNLIQKKNSILSEMGVWGRFRMGLSKLTNGVAVSQEARDLAKIEADLEKKDAERNKLQEEIQFMSYGENRSGRPTPDATVEKWANEGRTLNVPRKDGSWARGRVMDVANDGTVELSVEGAAKGSFEIINAPAREVIDWQDLGSVDTSAFLKTKGQAAKDMLRDAAAIVPGVKTSMERDSAAAAKAAGSVELTPDKHTDLEVFDRSLQTPEEREKQTRPGEGMSTEMAAKILKKKVAHDLWDRVNKALAHKPEARGFIAMKNAAINEYPATMYVYEVAKALEAQRNNHPELFEAAAANVREWSTLLDMQDDVVESILRGSPDKKAKKGIKK